MKILIKQYLNNTNLLLLLVLLLGLFFRLYRLEIFYPWGHDQDLFAWIAKDIMIDHHFRLIGQETSITGVFIGPIFYYLVALFMWLFKMNPLGAVFPTTIISLLTIFSIYWVFTKFFGKKIGLIGSFLYAVSPGMILFDRWVVPTQPTTLWCIWYLYVLLSILRGKIPLIILSLLIGLIWHVHIAFLPLLILLPSALLLSRRQGNKIGLTIKSIIVSVLALFILLLPFFIFETRHGFQQIKGLTRATYEEKGDISGLDRLVKVFYMSGRALSGTWLLDKNGFFPIEFFMAFPPLLLILTLYLGKVKLITKNQTAIFILWIAIDMLAQFISKRSIPEYYFANFVVILLLILSLLISIFNLHKRSFFILFLLGMYLLLIMFWSITQPDEQSGFLQKRKTVEYIKNDAEIQGYPCVAINYIEGQTGLPNGFRYLFWLNNLQVITAGSDVPVYSIVTPWTISKNEINVKFGEIGVILPRHKIVDPKICTDPHRQLLPLWGFNN